MQEATLFIQFEILILDIIRPIHHFDLVRPLPGAIFGKGQGGASNPLRKIRRRTVALHQHAQGNQNGATLARKQVQVFGTFQFIRNSKRRENFSLRLRLGLRKSESRILNQSEHAARFQVGEQVHVHMAAVRQVRHRAQGDHPFGFFPGNFVAVITVDFQQRILRNQIHAFHDKVAQITLDTRPETVSRLGQRVSIQFLNGHRGTDQERALL